MKRAGIAILVLVGAGGLIALFSFHPKAESVATGPKLPVTTASSSAAGSSTNTPMPSAAASYKDGTYTGTMVENAYGPVQVQAVVSGGKITAINFLQMPSDRENSQQIAAEAEPILRQEAIEAQSANIDTVSGATQDAEAFAQSLQSALSQAGA